MVEKSNSANVVPIGTGSAKALKQKKASLVRLPAPVHRLREKAAALLQQTLTALFNGADDALFDLADKATNNQDQNTYFEAMREVRLKRRETEKAFFVQLDRAYASLLRAVPQEDHGFATELSFDELTLVDNEQLEFQVALESMIAKVLERCAEPSQHIALRIDSLVPAKVYQANNPVGPDLLCRSFWAVVEPLDIDIKAKLVLLKLFDKAVMAQLHKIYTVLNNLLIQQNVLPSLSTRQSVRAASRPSHASASAGLSSQVHGNTEAASAAPVATSSEQSQVLEQLRGLLTASTPAGAASINQAGVASSAGAAASQSQVVLPANELAQVLTSLQQRHQPATSGAMGLLDAQQLLSMVQQPSGADKTMSAVDQDVMNLINMLFQFILDDRNLAAPMQSLLARLQIPLLKVAVVDKSFFNRAGHPARRLLNELATAALGWQEPAKQDGKKDPLFRKVSETVETIIAEFESDVSIFETLLTDFLAFIEKEQRRANVLERRTLDAEDGKAKAEQARAQVSEQLQQIVCGRNLPECVRAILDGPWHNVLFLTLLKNGHGSDEWLQASEVVEDLVWSVTEELDASGRKKLMSLLPSLLARLRQGCETISYNPFEMNKLLQQLEKVHLSKMREPVAPAPAASKPIAQPRQKAASHPVTPSLDVTPSGDLAVERGVGSESAVSPTIAAPAPTVSTSLPLPSESKPVVAPGVKSEVKIPAAASPKPFSANTSSATDDASKVADVQKVSSGWLEQVDRFSQGSWFEVAEDGSPAYRCRLAAVIKAVDKYIFVNRTGMKVAEKSREELAILLEAGKFNLLDDGMLFDRALESVIGNLRQSRGNLGS